MDRKALDEALSNMAIASSPFYEEYCYYLYLVSQCRVKLNPNLGAAAGVSFHKDHYVLHINPTEVIGTDKDGNEILGFCDRMPLEHRIGIIKHEMTHIDNGHLLPHRKHEDYEHLPWNIAADCALDQCIRREHLPSYALYPDNFPVPTIWGQSAEYYYQQLMEEMPEPPPPPVGPMGPVDGPKGEGEPEEGPPTKGSQKGSGEFFGVGDHDIWETSEGDPVIQQELTKEMVERAGEETIKSKGKLPANYNELLENLTVSREVDWKRVLRKICGNKKANLRKTIMRRDRRLPMAKWLKGKVKDRVFELAVVSDVSGSVGNNALKKVWGEVISICDLFKIPVTMVQVDSEPTEPVELTRKTKQLERKACGGTYLAPALAKFREAKIPYDALVVTTDGCLFGDDIEHFAALKVPVLWLIEPTGEIMPEMNQGRMRAIKLKG